VAIPEWSLAALLSFLAGLGLFVGSLVASYSKVSQKLLAVIMAFGGGMLISVLSFNLIGQAVETTGPVPIVIGFLIGAFVFIGLNRYIRQELRKRKKAGSKKNQIGAEQEGLSIVLGSLLDNIPEAFSIGVSLILIGTVHGALVMGIFISDLTEGMSGSDYLKNGGMPRMKIIAIWVLFALINAMVGAISYILISPTSQVIISLGLSFAAGAILAMVAEILIPGAFKINQNYSAIAVVMGFIIAFLLK